MREIRDAKDRPKDSPRGPRPHVPVADWGGSSLIMSLDEGCAGQAGAEPQTWETSRGRR
jgi:hypothetical protein